MRNKTRNDNYFLFKYFKYWLLRLSPFLTIFQDILEIHVYRDTKKQTKIGSVSLLWNAAIYNKSLNCFKSPVFIVPILSTNRLLVLATGLCMQLKRGAGIQCTLSFGIIRSFRLFSSKILSYNRLVETTRHNLYSIKGSYS